MTLRCVTLGFVVVAASSLDLTVVLDDEGPNSRPGTPWTKVVGGCAASGHEGGFHHNNGVLQGDFAVWNFSIPKSGCYWVEEFHPDTTGCDFRLHDAVPVHIHYCKGYHTAGLVDQSQRPGQWNKLVRLPFYSSHKAAIRISAKGLCLRLQYLATGFWAADAFRLVWDGEQNCQLEKEVQDNAVAPPVDAQEALDAETADPAIAAEEKDLTIQKKEDNNEGLAMKELPLHQTVVDDLDAEATVLGSTVVPLAQCPATAGGNFHHDGLRKGQRAKATFHFEPPRDGCYLVEEMHPKLEQCRASAKTKVRINYGTGLDAAGTVDQTANAGQWTFVAARPFYAGHPGQVTLSNEGTEPGTLTVFDQVRFTWSGKSCSKIEAHPRQAEIRLTVDFQHVANRPEFASALKTKLSVLADVPEKSLRLVGLRPGSIIAEFQVLPSVVDGPLTTGLDAVQTVKLLRSAVEKNAAELCALTGAPTEGCNVEFKDLGIVKAVVETVQAQQGKETEAQTDDNISMALIAAVCAGVFVLTSTLTLCFLFLRTAKKYDPPSTNESNNAAENVVTASMEEGKSVEKKVDEEKNMEDQDDNNSTNCPSSDAQSDTPVVGDADVQADEQERTSTI